MSPQAVFEESTVSKMSEEYPILGKVKSYLKLDTFSMIFTPTSCQVNKTKIWLNDV